MPNKITNTLQECKVIFIWLIGFDHRRSSSIKTWYLMIKDRFYNAQYMCTHICTKLDIIGPELVSLVTWSALVIANRDAMEISFLQGSPYYQQNIDQHQTLFYLKGTSKYDWTTNSAYNSMLFEYTYLSMCHH
jgi:hypothetical protein